LAKCVKFPKSWHSKNYAFEFVERISIIVQKEVMAELREFAIHKLNVGEGTDIIIQKILIQTTK